MPVGAVSGHGDGSGRERRTSCSSQKCLRDSWSPTTRQFSGLGKRAEFLEPEIALVTAGVETDVLGFHLDAIPLTALNAIVAAHPRPHFRERMVAAFADGMRRRARTTFGTVNADVRADDDPNFVRDDFLEMIRGSGWPE